MFKRLWNAVRRYVFRSSITGKFVSEEYAEAHPDTTQKERL